MIIRIRIIHYIYIALYKAKLQSAVEEIIKMVDKNMNNNDINN